MTLVCKVADINTSTFFPKRAGIVLYTLYDNEIFFGFGVDSIFHELTDFGGTTKYTFLNEEFPDKNAVCAALREFNEETLDIFEPFSENDIGECLALTDKNNIVIFINIDIDPEEISSKFNTRCRIMMKDSNYKLEVCGITWLSINQFAEILYSPRTTGILYSRIEKLFRKAKGFLNNL